MASAAMMFKLQQASRLYDDSNALNVVTERRAYSSWDVPEWTSMHTFKYAHSRVNLKNRLSTPPPPPQTYVVNFFLDFPIYLQSVETHSANGVLGDEGG
jgi:hypothetical protein